MSCAGAIVALATCHKGADISESLIADPAKLASINLSMTQQSCHWVQDTKERKLSKVQAAKKLRSGSKSKST